MDIYRNFIMSKKAQNSCRFTDDISREDRQAVNHSRKAEETTLLREILYTENDLERMNEILVRKIEEGERKNQDLKPAERNFSEDVIEAIPSLFYVIDENGTLIKWNKNVELVTGYSPEELQGMNVLDYFVIIDEQQYVRDRINEVFTQGKSNAYIRFRMKDGKTPPYFMTGVRTRINDKYYQIGVGIDCAEIEEAKETLREINERLALAAESAEAGLWAMDFNTNNLWMTQKCFDLHGIAAQENMDFESLLKLIDPAHRETFQKAAYNTVRTGEDLKMEYRITLLQGGYRWLGVRGRMHLTSSGEPDRLMGFSMDITDRKRMEEQLNERMKEVIRLKKQLEKENVYLREEVKHLFEQEEIICESEVFKDLLVRTEQVARTDTTALILGETGTGKEVLARAIHNMSRRRDRPLVTVNCASLPPSLIESELFGREKGAYTGALTKMAGRFEAANESTLFLDEVGELPLELQGKFLRAIELGRFERLGSTKSIQVNIRIIAATNRDLSREVKEGRFRSDLYYRLNVFPIVIPPLRERREDIPTLVCGFVEQFEKKLGKRIESIPSKTMDALQAYAWPGNIRELRNVIEHAMIISNKTLNVQLPASIPDDVEGVNLKEMERRHICSVLEKTGWRIAGKHGAAEILGLKRTTLMYKMKALGITHDYT
jgi:formate hydrogenlyase transcriptional activator